MNKGVNTIMTYKWSSILAVSVLTFGLVACSDSNNQNDITQQDNNEQENIINEPEPNEPEPNDTENNNHTNNEMEEPTDQDEEIRFEDPSIVALVNKQFSLDEDYAPDDLVTVEVPTVLENPEVNQL